MAKSTKTGKKKIRRNVAKGIVNIKASFNNTMICISDPEGDVICSDSGGSVGFKGSRKSTPFAAQRAAEKCANTAKRYGVREVEIKVKGPGSGRESAVSAIQAAGIRISSIEDITPLPHNGCRPKKRRRV